ncbi:MAG: hypothetical protein U0N82_13580 [Oscillospiraceae bacterium]
MLRQYPEPNGRSMIAPTKCTDLLCWLPSELPYRATHPMVLDAEQTIVTPLSVHTDAKSAARSGRAFCNKKRGEEKMKKKEKIYII